MDAKLEEKTRKKLLEDIRYRNITNKILTDDVLFLKRYLLAQERAEIWNKIASSPAERSAKKLYFRVKEIVLGETYLNHKGGIMDDKIKDKLIEHNEIQEWEIKDIDEVVVFIEGLIAQERAKILKWVEKNKGNDSWGISVVYLDDLKTYLNHKGVSDEL